MRVVPHNDQSLPALVGGMIRKVTDISKRLLRLLREARLGGVASTQLILGRESNFGQYSVLSLTFIPTYTIMDNITPT